MNDYFTDAKYIEAAAKAIAFMKRQLNVNNFVYDIEFAEEYGESFEGDVLYGTVSGLSSGESQTYPKYLSTNKYYDYDYTGALSGTWRNLSSSSNGINVYVIRDLNYKVKTYELKSGGSWRTETLYKEIYIVPDYDEKTGEQTGEHEEEVEYYLDDEIGEGIKDYRVATNVTSSWETIKKTEEYTVKRLVYSAGGEISAENGGAAYPYFNDFIVRLFTYSDAEYLCDECKIWNTGSSYLFYSIKAVEGQKIGKIAKITSGGYDVVGVAGAVANLSSGRIPASFLIPEDDPQYDKDGSKAKHKYGYCLNSRSWAYDVGLALLVFTTSGDYSICREMLNRMTYEQNSDGSFNFSYDIYIGQLFEGYVRSGAMGWLIWGACYYQLETGDTSYQSMIEKGGDWLISRQITSTDDPRYGLITGGIGAYDSNYEYVEGDIEWCSVEHQCSCLQALEGCSLVSKKSKYKKAAELIRDQLYVKCYDADNKRFYQGIDGSIPDMAWALDCTTWAGSMIYSVVSSDISRACFNTANDVYLSSNRVIVQSSSEEHYNETYSSSNTFNGFKPYSDKTPDYAGAPDIVWSEGTLGYALLAYILGKKAECVKYVDEMIKLQNANNSTGGILYVTETYASLPWEFHVWESVVSSAWLYLLIYNPSVLFPRTLRQVYYMAKITNIHDERP